ELAALVGDIGTLVKSAPALARKAKGLAKRLGKDLEELAKDTRGAVNIGRGGVEPQVVRRRVAPEVSRRHPTAPDDAELPAVVRRESALTPPNGPAGRSRAMPKAIRAAPALRKAWKELEVLGFDLDDRYTRETLEQMMTQGFKEGQRGELEAFKHA